MLRKPAFLLLLLVGTIGLLSFRTWKPVPKKHFGTGERVEYRIHYGFINAAEARVDIAKNLSVINGKPCYRINVFGRTTGAFDVFTKVRDTWRSFVDTTHLETQQFYRNIRENNYRKEETTYFDRRNNKATTKTKDTTRTYNVPSNVHDIISGYYFLRTVDFQNRSDGDIIELPVFLSDEVVKLRVKYAGRDIVKTKYGRIKVFKLHPLLPNNKLFKGENSIRLWVSDDENKVPIKIEADLFIGALAIDIKHYSGLQAEPTWF
jgi:hypothetical protein